MPEHEYSPGFFEDLVGRLKKAKTEAPTQSEIHAFDKQHDELVNQFLRSKISLSEFIKSNKEKPKQGVVDFKTLDEFYIALLALNMSEEDIEEVISHEQTHFELAEEFGMNPIFGIQFLKEEEGDLTMYPFVSAVLQEDANETNVREYTRRIAAAPGDDLSPSDLGKLIDVEGNQES